MEPTIYKPSIYNGAGIYKVGDEGGGGGGGGVKIGKNFYRTIIIDGVEWLAENFLEKIGQQSGDSGTNPRYAVWGGNYWNTYIWGIFYNWYAAKYIQDNKDTICPGWHVASKSEWENLILFAENNINKLKKNIVWSGSETQDIGISILPSGNTNANGSWFDLGSRADIWTITETGSNAEKFRLQTSSFSWVQQVKTQYGNIRLVRD